MKIAYYHNNYYLDKITINDGNFDYTNENNCSWDENNSRRESFYGHFEYFDYSRINDCLL